MRLSTALASAALLLCCGGATPLQKRAADFLSVRTKTQKDMSGNGDPPEKYFRESVFHPHYDGRFAEQPLEQEEQHAALRNLIRTYLAMCRELKVETWLMHGTLLGWWWGQKIMPWDTDIDVQVMEPTMFYLAAYYNMSIFNFKTRAFPKGRSYMLEVNPHYTNREQTDSLNTIDARWIDTDSGLFIDITTARYNLTHPKGEGMLSCKDGHEYRDTYLLPLRSTKFEGMDVKIPYRYKDMLVAEYGKGSVENTSHRGYVFDEVKMKWRPEVHDALYDVHNLYEEDAGPADVPFLRHASESEKVIRSKSDNGE
ncbi:hypothetical protein GQ53DRAFT_836410 [Thozetella sp. PMI_491]|nr:hypothetical protein GQ53DRAFT_836410 [Thozetella sp. PMI_491]